MQFAARTFGQAPRVGGSVLRRYPTASTSRAGAVLVEGRRNASWFQNLNSVANPVAWVKDKFEPKTRAPAKKEEVQAAKREAAVKGELGLLEAAVEESSAPGSSDSPLLGDATKAGGDPKKKKHRKKHTEHKYSTANFKISHRKLNDLGRQISNRPVDYALLQMKFSEKRASERVRIMLATAKRHAVAYKGLSESKLVVAQAWVTKGPRSHKRLDIRGRGKYGIKRHPDSRLHVILQEGATWQERANGERAKKLARIRSAGVVREDVPIRNPSPTWGW